jgi:acetyl-CoA acyltransferase
VRVFFDALHFEKISFAGETMASQAAARRVAIIDGLRTPFVKAQSVFKDLTALDLGKIVVQELVQRCELSPSEIDQVVFGQVIPNMTAPSIAREVVLASGLPKSVEAHTVVRACATSIQAMIAAANGIALSLCDVAIAGGTESMSDPPVFTSRPLAQALSRASRSKTLGDRVKSFQKLTPQDFLPVAPAIAEFSTGLTMGQSAEKMGKENGISREEQDSIALASHKNAAAALAEGRFVKQVMAVSVPPRFEVTAAEDNMIRSDASAEGLAALKPVFDRKYGTVTAGNASGLTDGAAALLLMSEEKAKSLGYTPLAFIKSHAFAATDPGGQLLQGPAYAAPKALDLAGMTLRDIELFEMHEAFAVQVASNIQALSSRQFAQTLGRSEPVGEVRRDRLNLSGGSIALGHPFAATGARIIHQAAREMIRVSAATALVTVCAQGGLGAAVVLERA